ncbi:MAG: 23S rRNA (uracil(1939)-C(5))-methyltransferase RlmD [Alicyclobacillus sp.]|nr:23S rRNA (uracil(1939)-C(5))-methyltransferase RlmD [Alicyclobacillus sp.]
MRRSSSPISAGEVLDVKALRLNDDGEGVAPAQGFTVFVPGLLPGERAAVEVTSVHARFARARLIQRRDSAAERVDPLCPVFGMCGGCQLQHLSYTRQLEHKREVVRSALGRVAKLSGVPVLPTVGMEHPWRYRNHVQVPLQYEAGRLAAGFFAPGGVSVVPTAVCHLMPREMEATLRQVVRLLPEVLREGAGAVHHLVLRRSHTTGEQMVALCVRTEDVDLTAAAEQIYSLPAVVSVVRTVQPNPRGPVWGPQAEVLLGRQNLTERVGGLEFLISPRSFFQVNTVQADRLYQAALRYARPLAGRQVLDAYCGTGTLALLLAREAARALGIESVPAAVEDAYRNARHNQMVNAEFEAGRVEEVLPGRVAAGARFDVAVLDPPRAGCHPAVLTALLHARPQRIVYVSCNPATFARDARRLVDGGYRLVEVQPVDMFPQTSHVECCALLTLEDG